MRFHDSLALASMKSACKSAINLMANFYRKIRKKTQSLSFSRNWLQSWNIFQVYLSCHTAPVCINFRVHLAIQHRIDSTFLALIRSSFNIAQSRWFAMTSWCHFRVDWLPFQRFFGRNGSEWMERNLTDVNKRHFVIDATTIFCESEKIMNAHYLPIILSIFIDALTKE